MPSSLTVNHPSASVYSTRPRVSVYGTGGRVLKFSGFSRQHDYQRCRIAPKGAPYCQGRLSARTCLRGSAPTPFNRLFRQAAAVPLLRPRITHTASNGMLTVSAIGIAQRLSLRTRLTPGRLAGFLGSLVTAAIRAAEALRYYQVRQPGGFASRDKPTPFNGLFRQPARLSLLRLHFVPAAGRGILTACPFRCASSPGSPLGPDLPRSD